MQREIVNPFTGIRRTIDVECRCMREAREASEAEAEAERRLRLAMSAGAMKPAYFECTFEKDDMKEPQASGRCRAYAERFKELSRNGTGLLLFGGIGCGKSFHSACIANALIRKGFNVVMVSVPDLVNEMQRARQGADAAWRYLACDLLILDDIGAERETGYAREQVYSIIDGRYTASKPMIASTNIEPKAMRDERDVSLMRIYSRLIEKCIPIVYRSGDRRLGNAACMVGLLDVQ